MKKNTSNYTQLSFWSEEYLESVSPRKKTKKELKQEAKNLFKQKLLEKVVLSDEEKEKYNFPLVKEELTEFFETNKKRYYFMNQGVLQRVLTSVSKYSNKSQNDLLVSDLAMMYKSITNNFSEIDYLALKKFSKANKLFFGESSYKLIMHYLNSLD